MEKILRTSLWFELGDMITYILTHLIHHSLMVLKLISYHYYACFNEIFSLIILYHS